MRIRPILVASIVAIVGAVILYNYLVRFDAEASGGTRVQVLWMNRPQEAGSVLKDDNLSVREIPIAYLEPRSVRAADRDRVVGLRLPQALKVRAMLLWSDVELADSNSGIEIQPGMRSFTIHVKGKSASLVQSGDRVDIVATFDMPGTASQQLRQGTVLLQNVLVLAHGQGKASTGGDSADLAISVTLQQAEMLALAVERGSLSVALRNSQDLNFFDQITTLRSDQLLDLDPKAPRAAPQGPTGPKRF